MACFTGKLALVDVPCESTNEGCKNGDKVLAQNYKPLSLIRRYYCNCLTTSLDWHTK